MSARSAGLRERLAGYRSRAASTAEARWLCRLAAGGLALWALVRIAGLDYGFPLVPLMAETPYVTAGAPVVVIGCLVLGRPRAAILGLVSWLALVGAVVPRTLEGPGPEVAPRGPEISVVAANLSRGNAEIDALERIVAERKPDYLVVVELTPTAADRIGASEIPDLLGNEALDPRALSAGSGIYARRPISDSEITDGGGDRDALAITASLGGTPLELHAVHPSPPTTPGFVSDGSSYIESLPDGGGDRVRILAGDFNSTLDNVRLRRLLGRGYTDAADARGMGLETTWSAGLVPPPVAIDHVLVDRRVAVEDFAVDQLPRSDHDAVWARLRLPAGAQLASGGE